MVTSLPFLPHRHSSRIRPRWIPRVSLQAETRRRTIQESFTTHYTHPFSLSCPSWPSFRQKRNQHPVGSLGILQVFRQRLFCELQFGQCSKLLRLSQTSTPRVLPLSTPGQDEMSLRQPLGHDHVPLRKNPGRLFFRCCRRLCPFFQWVNEDPRGKNRVWQVHLSLQWKTSQTHLSRCFDRNPSPERSTENKYFISNMEVLQDNLCFILDLEGFFMYGKFFHPQELGYYRPSIKPRTWNIPEHPGTSNNYDNYEKNM